MLLPLLISVGRKRAWFPIHEAWELLSHRPLQQSYLQELIHSKWRTDQCVPNRQLQSFWAPQSNTLSCATWPQWRFKAQKKYCNYYWSIKIRKTYETFQVIFFKKKKKRNTDNQWNWFVITFEFTQKWRMQVKAYLLLRCQFWKFRKFVL